MLAAVGNRTAQQNEFLGNLRLSAKKLSDGLTGHLIKIQEGEEVYIKYMKASSRNLVIPGLSEADAKVLNGCKKEAEEENKKRDKEKLKENTDNQAQKWKYPTYGKSQYQYKYSPYGGQR